MAMPAETGAPLRAIMVCAGGMSSSLVETHIRQAAEAAGVPLELRSMSVFELEHMEFGSAPTLHAVLVAPQVRFLRRSLERRLQPLGIAVLPIEPMDFGMADGEAILGRLLAATGRP
jgi:PTS system cellobiose-specific IIB component